MSCCLPQNPKSSIGKLFSKMAKKYTKRFKKRGLESSQQNLLDGLNQANYSGDKILEIGCGVGFFHQLLIKGGAISATGFDLSDTMIEEAKKLADENNLAEQTNYQVANFAEVYKDVAMHDLTILDKVICCYPQSEDLVTKSVQKTNKTYAVIYPRLTLFNKIGFQLLTLAMIIIRSDFRPFLYSPNDIESWITRNGFEKSTESNNFIWLSQVYTRNQTLTSLN